MRTKIAQELRKAKFILLLAPLLLAACATNYDRDGYLPPASYESVTVRSGDTLSEIAYRYQVHENDLVGLNHISDRDMLIPGQVVRIPAYGQLRADAPAPRQVARDPAPAEPSFVNWYNPPAQTQTPPRLADVPVPRQKPEQAVASNSGWWWYTPPQPAVKPEPAKPVVVNNPAPVYSSNKFIWPVSGRLLSTYGANVGGVWNDGINISVPMGSPIHAAGDGTVTYVGNELKGYGNLILIRHDNGYVTAYAHCDSVAVNRGDRVMRGQTVAYAGETGDVMTPQLHFEIRYGSKPVDPRSYLVAMN